MFISHVGADLFQEVWHGLPAQVAGNGWCSPFSNRSQLLVVFRRGLLVEKTSMVTNTFSILFDNLSFILYYSTKLIRTLDCHDTRQCHDTLVVAEC